MFKHVLIPVDGSELSMRAAKTGIEQAALTKGKVTAIHVISPFQTIAYMGAILAATEFAYNEEAKANGQRYLDQVKALADAAGVPFEGVAEFGDQPYETIVQACKDRHADLIVMGSNGWRGMTRLLLGSETHKVLLRADVPVLVCH
ncbi:universal stress protein [Dyella japonica]|uniref:Universal stress protein UspA n=1 Tax=Dyella japonica A8 TaxID=1217721 RepID=A0A075K3I1_9GAMM|nr:universal stress protein [Dyella japonica]AIF48267.1 universal stress protein UspA [Dyella japonica A8]